MSSQQPTVLFSIYQNRPSDTWSVRQVTQRIILKIVRFLLLITPWSKTVPKVLCICTIYTCMLARVHTRKAVGRFENTYKRAGKNKKKSLNWTGFTYITGSPPLTRISYNTEFYLTRFFFSPKTVLIFYLTQFFFRNLKTCQNNHQFFFTQNCCKKLKWFQISFWDFKMLHDSNFAVILYLKGMQDSRL